MKIRKCSKHDIDQIKNLLKSAELPNEDFTDHIDAFYAAEENSKIIGAIGLERYGTLGLVRSFVVDRAYKSRGIGRQLLNHLLSETRQWSMESLYLLTTTADRYFRRFGFEEINRTELPKAIFETKECQSICPDTAVCMEKHL